MLEASSFAHNLASPRAKTPENWSSVTVIWTRPKINQRLSMTVRREPRRLRIDDERGSPRTRSLLLALGIWEGVI